MNSATVLIVAKAPLAGQVKTRLCPPLRPVQAADLAAAALLDTLAAAAAAAVAGTRTVVALHGELQNARRPAELGAALSHAVVIPQRDDGFAARLVAAHADAGPGPVLQIGMDTPQLTASMLTCAVASLNEPGVDAVLGPASDGGWWALGLRSAADARVLRDVPMSQPQTGALTLAALQAIGLRVAILPTLTDVDSFTDALRVATLAPGTLFAAAVRKLLTDARLRVA